MKITIASLLVDDQEKAHRFYTEKAGFATKEDIRFPEGRWITLVSPEAPEGPELALEPDANPVLNGAAIAFKAALRENGIPYTAFTAADVEAECQRMKALGVRFTQEPARSGPVILAVFDDTCGNLIQIQQIDPS